MDERLHENSGEPVSGDRFHVLLVEDDPDEASLIRDALGEGVRMYVEVACAPRLKDALHHLAQNRCDVILLDLDLPDSRGLDTVRAIQDAAPNLPFVALTSKDDENTGFEAVRLGGQDALVKGEVSGTLLWRALRYAIARKQSEQEAVELVRDWQRTFDALKSAIWILDREQVVVRANKASELIFERPCCELVGMHCWEIVHKTESSIPECPLLRARNSLQRESWELYVGKTWYEVTVDPILDADGQYAGAVHVISDITERKNAEHTIRLAHDRLQRFIDSSVVGVVIADPTGKVIEANDYYLHLTGFTREEFNAGIVDWRAITPPEWLSADDKAIFELRKHGECTPYEKEYIRRDGKRVPVFLVDSMLPGPEEQIAAFALDLTERKQAEHALLASETRYRRLFESAKDGILILDAATGAIVDVNPFLIELLGFTHEYFLGKKLWDIGLFKDIADSETAFSELQKKDYVRYEGLPLETRDGQQIEVEFISNVYLVDSTEVIQCNIRNITERKRMEKALREGEEKFRAMVETIPLAIYLSDGLEQKSEYVNPEFTRLFGYALEDVPTIEQWWPLAYPDEKYRREISTEWNRRVSIAIETQTPIEPMEVVVTCKNGSTKDISWGYITVGDKNYACGLDLTERKRVERERESLEEQCRQAQKMEAVGQLAGGIAHDFNNILQAMFGYSSMLMDRLPKRDEAYEFSEEILHGAERGAALTRQLLAFSRRQLLKMEDLDLNDVVLGLIKMIRRTIGENIEVEVITGGRYDIVHADRGQMEQVLLNLCLNARDAMPKGGRIIISTESIVMDGEYCATHVWAAPGRYVLLSVTDSGCGMDAETQSHIFEPFFTTKALGKGTGLGLATVYGIVRQHQGMIQVYSEVDKGTTFKVYLPGCAQTGTMDKPMVLAPAKGGTETILLAEDDETLKKLAARILENAGYTVLLAINGEEALDVFARHSSVISLCLLDVVMPKLGGKGVYDALHLQHPHLGFLFSTGYSTIAIQADFFREEGVELI